MITLSYIDVMFLIALLLILGITIGFIGSLYFSYRGWNNVAVMQKTLSYVFSISWLLVNIYVILTQGQSIDWFFNAAGFIVMGHTLGINIAQHLPVKLK